MCLLLASSEIFLSNFKENEHLKSSRLSELQEKQNKIKSVSRNIDNSFRVNSGTAFWIIDFDSPPHYIIIWRREEARNVTYKIIIFLKSLKNILNSVVLKVPDLSLFNPVLF